MGWTCRRPGCHREAAATIGYDPVSCQVWLDLLGDGPAPAQMLCQHHAERLHAPRGWVVVDRRGDQMLIMTADPPPAPAVPPPRAPRPKRRPRRRWGQLEEPSFEFTQDENAATLAMPEPEPEPLPDPEPAVVVEPEREAQPEPEPELEPAPAARVEDLEPIVEETETELVPEPADDIGALLRPSGRLLSRAFAQTGAQRSAISALDGESPPTGADPAGE
jgi:hypothetical protein